jgi:hypothetical protein
MREVTGGVTEPVTEESGGQASATSTMQNRIRFKYAALCTVLKLERRVPMST